MPENGLVARKLLIRHVARSEQRALSLRRSTDTGPATRGRDSLLQLIRKAVAEFQEDQCPRMAAALAYYTVFSLAPFLILVLMISDTLYRSSEVEVLLETELQTVVGDDGTDQLQTMLDSTSFENGGLRSSIISGLMLIFGATGLMGQLQTALNDAWQVKPDPKRGPAGFITKRLLSMALICSIALLLLVSLVASSVLAALGDSLAGWLPEGVSHPLLTFGDLALSYVVVAVLFAALFKFLPDATIAWSDVVVGALLTAALFVIGKYAMGAYLGSKNMESVYGAAGSLALLLVWIYYSSMILLFGAEFTQVWARERGSGVRPAKGAIRVVRRTIHPGKSLA